MTDANRSTHRSARMRLRGRSGSVALVCAMSFFAAGCVQSREEPTLELIDSTLQTPEASYPLEFSGDSGNPQLNLRANVPGLRVIMGFFSDSPVVVVDPDPATRSVRFDLQGCFYQRDGGEKVAVRAEAPERGMYGKQPASAVLRLQLPPPLSGIALKGYKASEASIEAIEAIRKVRHRVYIPFRVDGEPYAIDASFELDVESNWYWAAPGVP